MNKTLKFALWLFVSSIFVADLVKFILDLSLVSGSVHQRFLTHFFRSSFFLFELIMGGMIVYFCVKHPERRWRLLSISIFHYVSVLILPLATWDFTWMAVLYPWPMTLLAFDPKTTVLVSTLSIIVGFIVVPAVTLAWGTNAPSKDSGFDARLIARTDRDRCYVATAIQPSPLSCVAGQVANPLSSTAAAATAHSAASSASAFLSKA